MAVLALTWPSTNQAQTSGAAGWAIERTAGADLWFHTLAIIGLESPTGAALYDSNYADRIAAVKAARGVTTRLAELAPDLRRALDQDPASQLLHDVPLYFASSTYEQMFKALDAVVLEGYGADALDETARSGFEIISASYRAPRQRRVLQVLLEVVRDEWDTFYSDYWEESAASSAEAVGAIRQQWTIEIAPALDGFLEARGLDRGVVLLSPALSERGRLYIYSGGPVNVATTRLTEDPVALHGTTFSIVRELCSVAVGQALRSSNVERSADLWENAAVRCGEMLLARENEDLSRAYTAALVTAADVPSNVSFTEVFPIDDGLEASLRVAISAEGAADEPGGLPSTGWVFRPRATTDLWYHVLAVIAADQPGPLGMYSADYATHIREIKRGLGVYPTRLDSLTADLNDVANGGGLDKEIIHFVPVYFPDSDVEEMLSVLRTPGHTDLVRAYGRQVDGWTQSAISELAEAALHEWGVFYEDYWDAQLAENRPRYDAVQDYWDRVLGPLLTPYLEDRRLEGGLVMPSMPIGPEGRITNADPYDGSDQIIAMWFPLTANTPEVSNFFFLKELCFLIVNDRAYGMLGTAELTDMRRTGAVRCGAMILDEYSPVLALHYRRTFLDAVGADESSTKEAFERVYYLDPSMVARLRAQITLPQ